MDVAKCGRCARGRRQPDGRGDPASILLGAIVGGVLLDGLTISATFIGSLVLAGFAIALIGTGRRLMTERGLAKAASGSIQPKPTGDRKCL
ncbi:hypothetical protein NKI19_14790 [Mesorhizobium sp. M0751]